MTTCAVATQTSTRAPIWMAAADVLPLLDCERLTGAEQRLSCAITRMTYMTRACRRRLTLFVSADASVGSLAAVLQAFQQLASLTANIGVFDAAIPDSVIAARMHGVRAALAALEAPAADEAVQCADDTDLTPHLRLVCVLTQL